MNLAEARAQFGTALAVLVEHALREAAVAAIAATPQPEPVERHTMVTAEVAEFLSVSEAFVLQLAHAGALPHRKVGRGYVFRHLDVVAWEEAEIIATSVPIRLHARATEAG